MIASEDWPEGLAPCKRTPVFTETTVPLALLRSHSTKEAMWGRLHVLVGKLRFVDDVSGQETTLASSIHPCIFPTREHHVAPVGEVRFFVEFCRPGQDKAEDICLTTQDNLPCRRQGLD